MGFVETEGIVLRKYNLADADRIVVILTEKRGLIRGVANGAKRLKSKFSSSLEFFSRISFQYFEKEERELVSIRNTDLLESVFGKCSNPSFFEAFSEIADLLIRFTPPNERNTRLYHMTRHCLQAASADVTIIEPVRVYFEVWLLKLGGFLPSWDICGKCSEQIGPAEQVGLQIDFRVVCANCGGGLEPVDEVTRGIFGLAQKTSPQKFSAAALKAMDELRILKGILSRISDAVLERAPAREVEPENSFR